MAQAVDIILVPYDCGERDFRMGRGPWALLDAGLKSRLEKQGVGCRVTVVEPEEEIRAEIATTFDLHRQVRKANEAARQNGRLPIMLTGNCNLGVIGALAAEGMKDAGLFWFDAHSDAETPETSTSGFLDGMGLAMVLGRCWRPTLASVGARALRGTRAALIGAREISDAAGALLLEEGVAVVTPKQARMLSPSEALQGAVEQVKDAGTKRVHVHLDLDVLDPELVGKANDYSLPDGVTQAQLHGLLEHVLDELEVASASVASYYPRLDRDGAVAAAAIDAIALLASSR